MKKEKKKLTFLKQNIRELNDKGSFTAEKMVGPAGLLTIGLVIAITKKINISIYDF